MSSVRIKVNQGIVRGCEEKLPDGRHYLRFSGIPYAKPPIGELRFKSPQKLLKFSEGEIDCSVERDGCYQRSTYDQKMIGSEDCLYLNVYVPSDVDVMKKLPVMIYIHGGGFATDSSSIDWYSPEYLLMENVIVVTINYRLHVLGFLSLPSVGISGNAGLKDQQMALEWVHENISNFNGDPNKICLFGESAGGASVHLQVLNPKSRKFVNSAICQSSCALADWVIQRDGIIISKKVAKLLGCKSEDEREVYKTLMAASADDLFRLKSKAQEKDERRRSLIFTFKPVIEEESDDAFMTKSPLELIKSQSGQINIPIIFGINDIDGSAMVFAYRFLTERFDNDLVTLVPRSLKIDPESDAAKALGNEIKRFYFGDKAISPDTIPQFIDHMTDFHFLIPQTICSEFHARYQPNSKQFLYEFGFDGELNHYKKLMQMQDFPGAAHADDLCYLFRQRPFDAPLDSNSRSFKMRRTMCKLWTNFSKYGDPTPDHNNPLPLKWNPVQHNSNKINEEIDLDFLIINDECKMQKNLHKNRIDFWRNVYRKWNKGFVVAKL